MLRKHPLTENTYYDSAIANMLQEQHEMLNGNPDFLSLSEANEEHRDFNQNNELDEIAKYKLFLSDNGSGKYINNDYYSNPVTRNLYRSWPVGYTSRRRDTMDDDIEMDMMIDGLLDQQLVTLKQYEYGNKLDFMDGLRRANWEGKEPQTIVNLVLIQGLKKRINSKTYSRMNLFATVSTAMNYAAFTTKKHTLKIQTITPI